MPTRTAAQRTILPAAALLMLATASCSGATSASRAPTTVRPSASRTPVSATSTPRSPAGAPLSAIGTPVPGLLRAAAGGDGDSWKDTRGTEYRLGLVNAPEYNECFGSDATRERKRLVAKGFRAKAYMVDRYGRRVADVTLADGRDLNVLLASEGFVNDRYLLQFRSENPALAARLDTAFRIARASRAGLWASCPGR